MKPNIKNSDTVEKRNAGFRLHTEFPGEYRCAGENDVLFNATIVNVNNQGICFTATEDLSVGCTLEMFLHIPNDERIHLLFRVSWSKSSIYAGQKLHVYQIGAQLITPLEPDREKDADRLKTFCTKNLLYPPNSLTR